MDLYRSFYADSPFIRVVNQLPGDQGLGLH